MINNYCEKIEKLIGIDVGGRGLSNALQLGDLEGAVTELYKSERVIIITGFCIRDTMTGETDGPIGTASLAKGLLKIGKEVMIVTDEFSVDLVNACCGVLEIDCIIEVVPYDGVEDYCISLIKGFKPTHVVALERPGRAKNGGSYSMRGEDLSSFIPNTDPLFWEAQRKGIKTIAIGDGGNEMGMGKIAEYISKNVKHGQLICAETSADFLIIAGVSNWGGHGIVAGLSLNVCENLLHERFHEIKMVEEMIKVGGVDGCSKRSECTVDGLSLETNLEILEGLHELIEEQLQTEKSVS